MARNPLSRSGTSIFLTALCIVLAVVIFTVDTIVPSDFAFAVLYVVVVLIALNAFRRSALLAVAAICIALTLLSYFLTHEPAVDSALVRLLVSLAAVACTTFLAVRNQSANEIMAERARLLDLTHDTIFVRDENDTITYWNLGAEELYGWRPAEAIGQNSHQIMKTVFPAALDVINAQLLETGRWEGELTHTKRDGTRITVASRWSLQRDARGRPAGTLETNNDITEQKHADESLQQAQAELAHVTRLTALGELTASIAHEVNQPLAGIVTNGEACLRWLNREPPKLDEVRKGVESMINDGVRASEVIGGLRTLTKKGQTERVPLNVNEVINQVILLLQRELFSHNVSLQLELAPDLPPIAGDRVQLQQVILNLIVNSVQAMASVTDRRRKLVVRSEAPEREHVAVRIIDNGSGIDPQNADRLFEAFFTTKPSGMGMGLSICRSIIEAHGGRVFATNNDGAGATFQFTLPAIKNEENLLPQGFRAPSMQLTKAPP